MNFSLKHCLGSDFNKKKREEGRELKSFENPNLKVIDMKIFGKREKLYST